MGKVTGGELSVHGVGEWDLGLQAGGLPGTTTSLATGTEVVAVWRATLGRWGDGGGVRKK